MIALLLSFLVSILLRFGFETESVIFYIDTILYFSGVIALFLLLRKRFSSLQSLFGALLYASSPVVLVWLAAGLTDIASLSISIWAFYFLVLAVEQSRFYFLAFPSIILTFLARFPATVMIFPVLLYVFLQRNILRNIRFVAQEWEVAGPLVTATKLTSGIKNGMNGHTNGTAELPIEPVGPDLSAAILLPPKNKPPKQ